MRESSSFLPAEERGAFLRILLGFSFLLITTLLLYYGNAYLAYVVLKLEGRDFGPMLFGSVIGLIVHGTQVLSLLMAWTLIGKGVGCYFSRASLSISIFITSIGIWLSWTIPPIFWNDFSFTFPLNVYVVIILVSLFQILTLHVENWIDKGTAMLLWIYAFQSLELLPSFPRDTAALSSLFHSMYRSNEEVAVASMAGTALSLSFMAGALTSTWLLARYSIRLSQVRRYWQDAALKEDHQESITEVNMLDLRTLVHDLKNPLAAIKGMAMMIREGKNIEKADIMLKAANYMEKMISEILREDQRNTVSISALISNLEKHTRPFPWAEHLRIIEEPNIQDICISINEIRMIRALLNILDNAWRANRLAGTKAIELHTRVNSCYLEIEILDNGPGYSSSPGSTSKSGWGSTGLGLAFVRKIVADHGGNILLSQRTDAPHGTSAMVCLPIPALNHEPSALL